jgi:hypothetical protein
VRDEVSTRFCNYPTRSRTAYERSKGETRSEHYSATIKQDHVLSMSGRRARLGQHTVLQLSEQITYSLWAIEGRDEVSTQFCNYLRRSHTSCGRSKGGTRSAHGPTTIQGDHILPGGDRRAGQGQHTVLQLFNEITYSLWAIERRNEVSTRF